MNYVHEPRSQMQPVTAVRKHGLCTPVKCQYSWGFYPLPYSCSLVMLLVRVLNFEF